MQTLETNRAIEQTSFRISDFHPTGAMLLPLAIPERDIRMAAYRSVFRLASDEICRITDFLFGLHTHGLLERALGTAPSREQANFMDFAFAGLRDRSKSYDERKVFLDALITYGGWVRSQFPEHQSIGGIFSHLDGLKNVHWLSDILVDLSEVGGEFHKKLSEIIDTDIHEITLSPRAFEFLRQTHGPLIARGREDNLEDHRTSLLLQHIGLCTELDRGCHDAATFFTSELDRIGAPFPQSPTRGLTNLRLIDRLFH
jgi:hypothetical protein